MTVPLSAQRAAIQAALDARHDHAYDQTPERAARLLWLYLFERAHLPAGARLTGRSWPHANRLPLAGPVVYTVELHAVDRGPRRPAVHLYRPLEGRVHPFDVIFAAAQFAALYDLNLDAQRRVERWLQTGTSLFERMPDAPGA